MTDRIVAELVAELKAGGVDPSALDDLVLDCFCDDAAELANQTVDEAEQVGAIDDAERLGSVVNNLGLEAQVRALVDGHAPEEGARLIREAAGEWSAENGRRRP